jgi:hypothetical protein
MVEDAHVDQVERVLQRAGQQLVGGARLGGAGGVVVGEDHRGGVAREGELDHFARIDRGLGERAAEQVDRSIRQWRASSSSTQKVSCGRWPRRRRSQSRTTWGASNSGRSARSRERAPRQFHDRLQLGILCQPHAGYRGEVLRSARTCG